MINDYSVDIIIPIRSREEYDVFERLEWRLNYNLPDNFQYIVVDYGSVYEDKSKHERFCEKNSIKYYYIESARGEIWNASKARNYALKKSCADYVFFEDVDLISHKNFYFWINSQIQSLIVDGGWSFFVVPVSYLTEQGVAEFKGVIETDLYSQLTTEIFNEKNSKIIDFHVPVSSYLLCRRDHAIMIGGYDEKFEGWGFEDSDFWLRLLRSIDIELPNDFYKLDTRNYSNQVQWSGWRALFRIFGDLLAYKGIYSFHIWHPIANHRSDHIRKRNYQIFIENTNYYRNDKYELLPLWREERKSHLFLSRNPHSFNRYLFNIFDNPYLIEESDFEINKIDKMISELNIESVVFNNPYGSAKRKVIYDEFKKRGITCYVVERGALPWSIYIDKNGFCAESDSYLEGNWDTVLTEEKKKITKDYINNLRLGGDSLEPQSSLIGGGNLKRKLFGSSPSVKILFVALQSPSDTTTNYFCGPIKTYDNFINEIKKLPYLLGDSWKVVYKNHPLTIDKVEIENAFNVDGFHINDIIEASDSIALINSGVGVLAAVFEKPVFYFGQAFYACDGINKQVQTAEDLILGLDDLNTDNYNSNKSLRFISYLINDFYSFAKWKRKERSYTNKAKLSISVDIKYRVLRVFDQSKRMDFQLNSEIDLKNSILFDRYRLDDYLSRSKSNNKPQPNRIESRAVVNSSNSNVKKPRLFFRKFKKLINNPNLYFADLFIKRLENKK